MKARLREILFYVFLACFFGMAPGIVSQFWADHIVPRCLVAIALCALLGFLLAEGTREIPTRTTTAVIGAIKITSDSMMVGDSLTAPDLIAVSVPPGEYTVEGQFVQNETTRILTGFVIGEWQRGTKGDQGEYEVVVDSGELLVVDRAIAENVEAVKNAKLQLKEARKKTKDNESFVCTLSDKDNNGRGIAVAPPYGDGAYIVKSQRTNDGFEMRCDFPV